MKAEELADGTLIVSYDGSPLTKVMLAFMAVFLGTAAYDVFIGTRGPRRARLVGDTHGAAHRRTWVDWVIVGAATAVIIGFATMARAPQIAVSWGWMAILGVLLVITLAFAGLALWRTTRFS